MDVVAYLTPESNGYSVIQADLGRLTVSLIDVEPYAGGRLWTSKASTSTGSPRRVQFPSRPLDGPTGGLRLSAPLSGTARWYPPR